MKKSLTVATVLAVALKRPMKPLSRAVALAVTAIVAVPPLSAENVDPTSSGAQYAWAENIGWLNAQPLGPGGPGLEVFDFGLTGWMWAENAGWISLSCENTASCQTVDYRVLNNGSGLLSGFAWAENLGWINFGPGTGGVSIDPTTGAFAGTAWGENIGWISFSFSDPTLQGYQIRAGWTCSPPPSPPSQEPILFFFFDLSDELVLLLSVDAEATAGDVVMGDLLALRSSGGDFGIATDACYADKSAANIIPSSETPPLNEGFWYLARYANCGGLGSYGSADADIAASGNDCSN